MFSWKKLFIISFVLVLLVLSSLIAWAEYPEKPIKMIIPFGAGGGNDVEARVLQPYLEEELGVPVVIINKPGGGGQVGSIYLSNQKPDGYQIGMDTFPSLITRIVLYDTPYTINDFDYIGSQTEAPKMLCVRNDSPFDTIEDFIEYAKEHPGEITISNAGTGSSGWFAQMALEKITDIDIVEVPFGGTSKAISAFLGGHVMAISPSLNFVYSFVQNNQAKLLAVMAKERHPDFPEIPTFKEKGYNLLQASVRGVLAPAGLPEDVLAKLRDAFDKSFNNPKFQERAKKADIILNYKSGEECKEYMEETLQIYQEISAEITQE